MTVSTNAHALGGLRVLNLSNNLIGAFMGQFLADYGAEVVLVEPAGGSPLRTQAAWPMWLRGSKSIVAALDDPAVHALAQEADIIIETFRPGTVERFGLDHDRLAVTNPRLISASITGFGRTGPFAELKGYEGAVMAKIGGYSQFTALVNRDGPAYASVPYCSASAALLAIGGILTAVYERESSGLGQRIDTSLIQAIASQDTWNWMIAHVAKLYPDAFQAAPVVNTQRRVPNSWLSYGLLQGVTADGRWLQFSQASPKLFRSFLEATGLDDPEWNDAWESEDLDRREAFWDRLLGAVRSRTVAEWQQLFDQHPNVFAEVFRSGHELLDHPQMQFDDQVATVDVPGAGRVRAPKPFVRLSATPGSATRPVPAIDADGDALRASGWQSPASETPASETPGSGTVAQQPADGLPLDGILIVDLGGFYAAPYGLSILADLGARVIKIEPLEGDTIRYQLPFPEVGGVKVMQGKESVAIDLGKPAGIAAFRKLIARADILMHNFREGVAPRLGVDEASVRAINPDIIYHEAPGFGTKGPYGRRPAYAPTIGAGAGMARRNVAKAVPEGPDVTLDQVKDGAVRMGAASMTLGHADGFAALGVLCAELLALVAKKRGLGSQAVETTMLFTMAQILSEDMIDYSGRPPVAVADAQLYGLDALYRLYETAEGWVFLAAPQDDEWDALKAALPDAGLDDPRFASAERRHADDAALADALAAAFRTRPAAEWEALLTAVDVSCTLVDPGPSQNRLMESGGLMEQLGMVTSSPHPLFGDHARLKSVIAFSRSATQANPSPAVGEHTNAVLAELGYGADELAALSADKVILQG